VGDFEEEMMEEMAEIYSLVMARSRLDWRTPDKEIRRASLSIIYLECHQGSKRRGTSRVFKI
jgi:hypothetical protein